MHFQRPIFGKVENVVDACSLPLAPLKVNIQYSSKQSKDTVSGCLTQLSAITVYFDWSPPAVALNYDAHAA